jgi:glycine betaine/proline transport system ATP-binding protein
LEENSVENNDCEICIEAKGLWKVFGKRADEIMGSDLRNASKDTILEKTGCVVAVRNVSFTVKKGEFFVIMGLSGSGKSTLIRRRRCLEIQQEETEGFSTSYHRHGVSVLWSSPSPERS